MPRQTAEEKQAETRAALIRSAIVIFTARGYQAASLGEISEAAGYSTGAVYSNFSDKEGLFRACIDHHTAIQVQLWEKFIARAEELGTDEEDLAEILRSVRPKPAWQRVFWQFQVAPKSDESTAVIRDTLHQWRDMIRRMLQAVAKGNNLVPVIPFEDAAVIVSGLLDGLSMSALADPNLDVERIFATSVRVLLGGTAEPAEGGRP